jgi:hypothetical protein
MINESIADIGSNGYYLALYSGRVDCFCGKDNTTKQNPKDTEKACQICQFGHENFLTGILMKLSKF